MESKEFMLIFLGVDYGEMNLSMEEIEKRAKSWMAWQQKMAEAGIMQSGNALQSPLKRISGSDRTVTDRISVEAKEIIGGYYIVKAQDFDDAAKIAQDYPDYDLGGTVEIRELIYYN
ncbi:MAG: YciI family protein [Bacteroidota bacterium]